MSERGRIHASCGELGCCAPVIAEDAGVGILVVSIRESVSFVGEPFFCHTLGVVRVRGYGFPSPVLFLFYLFCSCFVFGAPLCVLPLIHFVFYLFTLFTFI